VLLPAPDSHSGSAHHLIGANEPLLVARKQLPRGRRIEPGQPFAKRVAAQRPMKLDGFLPDLRGDFWNSRQSLHDRAQVEAGAADQDWQATCLFRPGDLAECKVPPSRNGPALGGVEEAVEPVRHTRLRRFVGPRCQYPKIVIALQAVGIDDRAAQRIGQFERERRFAARRGAGDNKDGGRTIGAGASPLVTRSTGAVGGRSMTMVLTLIAGVGRRQTLPHLADAVAGAVGISGQPTWLADDACDLVFDANSPGPAEAAARAAIGAAQIDVLVQPVASRRKRLLVADMESTIIENEMLDELADFIGRRRQVSEITRRAMNGEIDFATSLKERVGLLAGVADHALERAAERIRLRAGARQLIATMRSVGAVTALVSSGFMIFAERVAAELGFDHVEANRLDLAADRIAGTVSAPIVTGETKRQILLALAAKHGVPLQQSMAVGDGANDLSMLTAAGMGVAFHAKPLVAARARWRLDHADLTGLLYAQGYRRDEIVG
jgi:phosphoserine phosphatase